MSKMLNLFRNILRKTNFLRTLRKYSFNFFNFKLKNELESKIKLTKIKIKKT